MSRFRWRMRRRCWSADRSIRPRFGGRLILRISCGEWVCPCENNSFQSPQQFPRLPQQRPDLRALGDRVPGKQSVPPRVAVSPWRAGISARHRACGSAVFPALPARGTLRRRGFWRRSARSPATDRSAASGCSCRCCSLAVRIRNDDARMVGDVADDGLAAIPD